MYKSVTTIFVITFLFLSIFTNCQALEDKWSIYVTNHDKMSREVLDKAKKVKVAIIDTGIQTNHPLLLDSNIKEYVAGSENNEMYWNDPLLNVHGTMVASVLAARPTNKYMVSGVIPGIQITSIRAGTSRYISLEDLSNAILEAIEQKSDIISLSLCTYTDSPKVRAAIEKALVNNITVVASVGNDFYRGKSYPASYPNVIAVTGVDNQLNILPIANSNNDISVAAPGENIKTVDIQTDNITDFSGTSVAVPFVVGLAAIIKSEDNSLNVTQIKNIIERTAKDLGNPGKDIFYGNGIIDFYKAISTNRIKRDFILAKNNKKYLVVRLVDSRGIRMATDEEITVSFSDGKKQIFTKGRFRMGYFQMIIPPNYIKGSLVIISKSAINID